MASPSSNHHHYKNNGHHQHHNHHHEQHHKTSPKQQQHSSTTVTTPSKIIIIAMDGSEHSFHAFDWYMKYMHSRDSEVIVVHSSTHSSTPFPHVQNLMPSVLSSETSMMTQMKDEEEEVNRIVLQIKGMLTQAGVRGKLLRLTGEPGPAIVHAAIENNASCIVTGSRGLGKVKRALVGSVSDYILHHSHCPVLICRHKDISKSS